MKTRVSLKYFVNDCRLTSAAESLGAKQALAGSLQNK